MSAQVAILAYLFIQCSLRLVAASRISKSVGSTTGTPPCNRVLPWPKVSHLHQHKMRICSIMPHSCDAFQWGGASMHTFHVARWPLLSAVMTCARKGPNKCVALLTSTPKSHMVHRFMVLRYMLFLSFSIGLIHLCWGFDF